MPDQNKDLRSSPPSRQILLAADKEELVERIESLQADLQRRMEVEEELLHVNLQKGTASLQAQVEEASRRFKVAQQELEAFRLEILQADGDPAAVAPRPYIYEDLAAPPQEGPDRSQLRSLLTTFRRLRDERDRLKQEIGSARDEAAAARGAIEAEKTRAEKAAAELATLGVAAADFEIAQARLQQELEAAQSEVRRLRSAPSPAPAPSPLRDDSGLRGELSEARAELDRLEREAAQARGLAEQARIGREAAEIGQARAVEEADALRASNADFDAEIHRLRQEVERMEAETKAAVGEQADLGRKLAYEQAKTEQLAGEARQLVNRLAETARKLEEARWELEHPGQTEGFDRLEKFFDKARLRTLLEKSVRGPQRKDQAASSEIVYQALGAAIGAQEQPLEAARHLMPRLHRPQRRPGLGELRQLIEDLRGTEVDGVKRVHDALRASFFSTSRKQELLTVDLDSPELVVGRRPEPDLSYWPLVLYVPELQEFWHAELRPSPENPPKQIADFLAEGLSRAPSAIDRSKLQFRLDARFYGDAVLRLLEAKKCSYVVAPPDSRELRTAARACDFADITDGWEAGEWSRKGRSAQAPALRFVALRHARAAQPSPTLPFLFRDPRFVYYAFAVDRRTTPRQALDAFAAREASQEREHALLRDFTVNRLLSRGPEAHGRFLQIFVLSADLLQWYRRGMK